MTEHNIIVRLVDSEGKILDERAVDDMWHLQGALDDIEFCNDVILPGYSITITETADKHHSCFEGCVADVSGTKESSNG